MLKQAYRYLSDAYQYWLGVTDRQLKILFQNQFLVSYYLLNITNSYNVCTTNCDINKDGWPEKNIDLDGNGIPDLNIDTDIDFIFEIINNLFQPTLNCRDIICILNPYQHNKIGIIYSCMNFTVFQTLFKIFVDNTQKPVTFFMAGFFCFLKSLFMIKINHVNFSGSCFYCWTLHGFYLPAD